MLWMSELMCGRRTLNLYLIISLGNLKHWAAYVGTDSNRYEPQLIAIYYERETDLLCGQRPVFVNKLMVEYQFTLLDVCGKC